MNVLVVDDDGYSRRLISYVLEEAGHTVCRAENGLQAITVWESEQPDLILMDLVMPVLDGYDSALRIKQKAGSRLVPIVFMTALSEDAAMVRCLTVGEDFLLKPINLVMLQAKIQVLARNLELNRQVMQQNRELAWFRAKVSAEFDMTQQIMRVALENNRLDVRGIEIHCSPHSTFNGDLVLVHEKQDGGVYLLVGDFTGHGLASSIGSVPVSQTFTTMTERNASVGIMAREINRTLHQFLPRSMFCALVLLEFNPGRTVVEAWAGGLPDAFILDAAGQLKRRLSSSHMPAGILDHQEFEILTERLELAEGDRFVLYTDGFIEAVNPEDELFGERRLLDVITRPTQTLIPDTLSALKSFVGSESFQDDLSMVVVDCVPNFKRRADSTGKSDPTSQSADGTDNAEPEPKLLFTPSFTVEFSWTSVELRHADPLAIVRDWMEHHPTIRVQKELALSILSEAFNNALDHGVLGMHSESKGSDGESFERYYRVREQRLRTLDWGYISMKLVYRNNSPGELVAEISDSGPGFDYRNLNDKDTEAAFGRGLPLIRAVCNEVSFEDEGATIRLRLPLY